jgi:ribosomal protein S6--L-glutamate ligase
MTSIPLKIAVVGIPGKWSTEVLADELEQRTGFRLVIDVQKIVVDLANKEVRYQGLDLCKLDGIIVKKISEKYSPAILDRVELLRFVESCGVKIFSKPCSIYHTVDRLSGTITLMKGDIPMPPTTLTEDLDAAYQAVKNYGTAILKPLYSTKARGMELLSAESDPDTLKQQLKTYYQQQGFFYLQKKLSLPGHDMGLVFLGGEYQGAYARHSGKDCWDTTIHSGGKYAPAHPSDEIIEIAQRAQGLFNLDYTTVDMAETEMGPVCFEVSAFGGFKGAQNGLGLNMAGAYADYVIQQLQTA